MKHRKRGLDDKFMEFCKIASVVDRFDLKPNWQFDMMFSYASLILFTTNDASIFEHVDIMDNPRCIISGVFVLMRQVMDDISQDDGIIKVVQIVVKSSIKYTRKRFDLLYLK